MLKAFKGLFIPNNRRLLKPFLRVYMYFTSIKHISLAINYFTANGPNIKWLSHHNTVGCLLSTCLIRATCSVPLNLQLTLIFIRYVPRN